MALIDLNTLTVEHFRSHLQQPFETTVLAQIARQAPTQQTLALALAEATALNSPNLPGARQGFSLMFVGPSSTHHLPQRTYALSHPDLGVIDIFLTPIGPATDQHADPSRMRYQAIFN